MKKNIKNTKSRGLFRTIFFKEEKTYVGVCLDFNIVEESKNFQEVQKSLTNACVLHLETVREKKLPDSLLNRHAPEEYWEIAEAIERAARTRKRELISSTVNPYSQGSAPALALC